MASSSSQSENEEKVKQQLQDLQKQLGKKHMFEDAVSSIDSLLLQIYPSASPSLRKLFYSVISRVATILKTRYTAPGFWMKGMQLFENAEKLTSDSSEKQHLKSCIAKAREHLHDVEIQPELPESRNRGYLFEGHLTVDQEPPQPSWLVQSNLLSSVAAFMGNEPSQNEVERSDTSESINNLLQGLMETMDTIMPEIFDDASAAPRVPPASKEVVAKLPIITITEEILTKLGKDAECAICKENLLVGDKMQELPCKHTFHPPCLKPWLDEHNSCPICRHELKTDDHSYESWKEREKEAAEERKGAENAVRGGEYMYV